MFNIRHVRGFALVALKTFSFGAWDASHAASLLITGTPGTATSGETYRFKPTVTGAAKGKSLTFTSKNVPAWARFDPKTGLISGKPAKTDANKRYPMYIIVNDGVSSAWMQVTVKVNPGIPPLSVKLPSVKRSVTVSWKAPSANVDNSPVHSSLAGYRVFYGKSADKLSTKLDVVGATMTSVCIEDLMPGTYFFAVKAYGKDGVESELTPVMQKTL